jgi:hypothetical protein
MFNVAAAVFLLGTVAYSSFATEIPENFSGITNQVAGDASGIFDVPKNSAVHGTLIFDPSDFSPNPVVPSGSSYLAVFLSGANSVKLDLWDAGGSAEINAQSAFLEVSSSSNSPWSLLVTGQNLSFSMILQMPDWVHVAPGTSLFDFSAFEPSVTSILISSPQASLGFAADPAAVAPEPAGGMLFAAGLAVLLLCFAWPGLARSVSNRTIPGLRIPNRFWRVY